MNRLGCVNFQKYKAVHCWTTQCAKTIDHWLTNNGLWGGFSHGSCYETLEQKSFRSNWVIKVVPCITFEWFPIISCNDFRSEAESSLEVFVDSSGTWKYGWEASKTFVPVCTFLILDTLKVFSFSQFGSQVPIGTRTFHKCWLIHTNTDKYNMF